MDRRGFLGAVAGVSGLAGCTGVVDTVRDTATPTSSPTASAPPTLAEQGFPASICEQDVVDIGIYAVEDPAFAPDWSDVDVADRYATDGRLTEDAVVVGVAGDDRGRAYPLSVLWHHEIVNDSVPAGFVSDTGSTRGTESSSSTELGGDGTAIPLLVTYCPICRSGMVAERRVAGRPTIFGVSGQLWVPPQLIVRASEAENRTFGAVLGNASADVRVRNSGNLVMVDEATGSFWSQILARAICGPRRGDSLPIVPSTLTTWGEWRASHPGSEVLLPPPHSTLQQG